jgi:hypothetical protein
MKTSVSLPASEEAVQIQFIECKRVAKAVLLFQNVMGLPFGDSPFDFGMPSMIVFLTV